MYFFILKFMVDTSPFLGPLVPLFWISDISSEFQSKSRFCLIHIFAEDNVRYIWCCLCQPFDSQQRACLETDTRILSGTRHFLIYLLMNPI